MWQKSHPTARDMGTQDDAGTANDVDVQNGMGLVGIQNHIATKIGPNSL